MKKLIIFSVLAAGLIFSCKNNSSNNQNGSETPVTENYTDTVHTSRTSLDYAGTYKGVIPCADCSGIEVEITLDDKGNYKKKMTYQGKEPDNVFATHGTYKWDESGSKITLLNESDTDIYQVGENTLIMLDGDGKKITGALADMFILRK